MILILNSHWSVYLLRLEKCSNVPAFDHDFNHLMKFDPKWVFIVYHVFFVSLFFGLLSLGKGVAKDSWSA